MAGRSGSSLERSMRRTSLIAVGTGIVVLWLTQWGQVPAIDVLPPSPTAPFPYLSVMLLDLLLAAASLLPGFCAGLIAGRRGILLGTLTGLIGSLTYSVLFMGARLYSLHSWHAFTLSTAFLWFWSAGPGLTLKCAAGGAAGEVLRSNKRLERP
jgi:hypothetical protein